MIKPIIIVDSLPETVKAWGIEAMDNTIFQEMGGDYWFVDVDDKCSQVKEVQDKRLMCADCEYCTFTHDEGLCRAQYQSKPIVDCSLECEGRLTCLKPLPLKIAHLVMQFIKAQRDISMVSVPTVIERPSKLKAYIPAGGVVFSERRAG